MPADSTLLLNGTGLSTDELLSRARKGDDISVEREGYHPFIYTISSLKQRELFFELEPLEFTFELSVFTADTEILIDGRIETSTSPILLTYGPHLLEVKKEGLEPVGRDLFVDSDFRIEIKLLRQGSRHEFLAKVDSGRQPKQLVFSPDGKYLFAPLLAGDGFDIVDLADFSVKRHVFSGTLERLGPKKLGDYVGFVEGVFNKRGDRFLISQMTTASIHVMQLPEIERIESVYTGGSMPKVVAYSPDEKLIAVSNWGPSTIAIIDAATLKRIELLQYPAKTPRGLAFSPDGKYLYIAYFDSGHIIKASTQTWKSEKMWHTGGANRHIVIDSVGKYAYISNMAYSNVYILNLENDKIEKAIDVGPMPNTIALTPDDRFLYVSCRGPNNPKSYLLRSLVDGSIHVIDTDSLEVVEIIPGGNQPTGLAISPDGKLLAGSNFQDHTIEFYAIKN